MKKLLSLSLLLGFISFSADVSSLKNGNYKSIIKKPRYKVEISSGGGYDLKYKKGKIELLGSFIPEWEVEIDKKIGVTFGPKIVIGVESNIKDYLLLYNKLDKHLKQYPNYVNSNVKLSANTNVSSKSLKEAIDIIKKTMPIEYELKYSVVFGGEIDINYKIKENVRIYTSVESGLGVRLEESFIADKDINRSIAKKNPEVISTLKISLGTKIDNKYDFGFYGEYGKNIFGIKLGYII